MGRKDCPKEGLNRGTWTAQEDQLLKDYVKNHGEGKWGKIPKETGLKRCGKSCRLRWLNYLRPNIKRGNISLDEEDLIIRLHKLLGNRWSLIAGRLPGRTDNEIKNYWNSTLRKKLQDFTCCKHHNLKENKPQQRHNDNTTSTRVQASATNEGTLPAVTKHMIEETYNSDENLFRTNSDINYGSSWDFLDELNVEINGEQFILPDFLHTDFYTLCETKNISPCSSISSSSERTNYFSEDMLQYWSSNVDSFQA